MSRAASCLVSLMLVSAGFAALASQSAPISITLPDGSQVQVQGDIIGGVQGGIVGGLTGGTIVGPQGSVATGPQGPGRDTRPTTGNSRIRGRVLIADTGQPARRASVNISAPEVRSGRTATTDMDGRFEFTSLPPGRYSISASKNGYIGLAYGQTRPTTPSQTLTLADKQNADGVELRILRGGAITGRVVDDFGDPVSGVAVMSLRAQFQQGQQRLVTIGPRAMTNDIGEYRLFALPAGSYYVAAIPQSAPPFVNGAADVIITGSSAVSEERSGLATVFYPGTTDPSTAPKVVVAFGQTTPEVNVSLVSVRLSQVSGMAVDSQGHPMTAGSVLANPRGRVQGLQSLPGQQLRPDGTFVIPNMPPGEYTLRATARQPPPPPPTPGAPRPPLPRPEVAIAVLTVNGDVSGVRLAPVVPVTISGRVVFDDPSAAASLKPAALRMSVQNLNPSEGPSGLPGLPPSLKDDFSFEFAVDPGLVMLRPNVPGGVPGPTAGSQPWGLKALRVNGVDVTNTGLDVRPGERVGGIEIEMTNRPAEVSGTVTAGGSAPAAGFNVIVFSQDRELWSMPGPGLSATLRTDQSGRFSTRNLRPGRYYILAVYELEQGSASDPEFLQSAASRATAFALADGETKTIDLRGQAR